MGGSALQYVKTGRKTAAEYYPLMESVLDRIANLFPMAQCTIIKNYADKPDFGDGDILIDVDSVPPDWARVIQQHFNPDELVINRMKGTPLTFIKPGVFVENPDVAANATAPDVTPDCQCVSFDHQGFQIDIMPVSHAYFGSARDYYAYNDLGNLIGRIANHAGYKFGWQGLRRTVKLGSQHLGDVGLTVLYPKMLAAFGYDPKRWAEGFKTRDEVFEYAASSPYFHRDLFKLENLNHENRARNKKRVTFMAFLAWLADKPHLDKHQWVIKSGNEQTPALLAQLDEWERRLEAAFPGMTNNVEYLYQADTLTKSVKERFNATIITQFTDYRTNKLGQFMNYCELTYKPAGSQWPTAPWEHWVMSVGPQQLYGFVLDKRIEFDNLTPNEQADYARKRPRANDPHEGFIPELYAAGVKAMRDRGENSKE